MMRHAYDPAVIGGRKEEDRMKYIKTELGQQAFKARSPLFSVRQRTAFIMFDGQKTVEQVLASGAALGLTLEDVDHMAAQGFLLAAEEPKAAAPSPAAAAASAEPVPVTGLTSAERFVQAKTLCTRISASLGLRGFMLNMLVEEAENLKDLEELLPKLKAAAGVKAVLPLEELLKQ